MRVLLIDNHDSFSAILHHYLWELTGVRPLFYRNDELTREQLRSLNFDAAVLSPGPGHPGNARDFGICRDVLELFPRLPVLGVCLGHQGLAQFAGGRVVPLPGARHGRPSAIRHDGEGLFRGLPTGFQAVRYHSLVVEEESLPQNIVATAWSGEDRQLMGLRFTDRPWFGVQFHPESIGTEYGKPLLANFLEMAAPGILDSPGAVFIPEPVPEAPGREIPYRELSWKDPEGVFLRHFSRSEPSFWLEGPGWPAAVMGRAESTLEIRDWRDFRRSYEDWNLLETREAPWPGYRGGPVGHFAYELHRQILTLSPTGSANPLPGDLDAPLGRWMVPQGYLVFDAAERRVFAAWENEQPPDWLEALMESWDDAGKEFPEGTEGLLPPFPEWNPSLPREDYLRRVRSLQESIAAGETYEACLTHAFRVESGADPVAVFRRLRRKNPAPFAAYMAFNDLRLLSASPELFLELSPDGVLRSRPIKGTRPRGRDAAGDAALRQELGAHPKDLAENRMIVDLTRHDFSRVCVPGSVEAPSLMEVETHPAVFQLVSEVRGKMKFGQRPLDAVEACFPGGSMTGAPKERTVELLSSLETEPRGAFSGAMGYFTRGGAFTLAMVIRTLENRGRSWRAGCGGAVLADSDPGSEWEEASLKARSVIGAASL